MKICRQKDKHQNWKDWRQRHEHFPLPVGAGVWRKLSSPARWKPRMKHTPLHLVSVKACCTGSRNIGPVNLASASTPGDLTLDNIPRDLQSSMIFTLPCGKRKEIWETRGELCLKYSY